MAIEEHSYDALMWPAIEALKSERVTVDSEWFKNI